MISGNHFTLDYVFGKHRKLGQTEINRVDRKITRISRKWISVSILPSNEFQDKDEERERERERESKKREHRWFTQPSSGIDHWSLIIAQPLFDTNTHHQSLIFTQPSFDPNTDPLSQPTPPSSPIHKHPRPTSPIASHALTSIGWALILTTDHRPCPNVAAI